MSQTGRGRPIKGTKPDTGEIVDRQWRNVQTPGDGNQVSINLTDFGRRMHDIQSGDTMQVEVCERGIFITTDE